MKSTLIAIVSKFKFYNSPDHKVLLGRWALDNCHKARNIKIDMSNEDNCGVCNHYRLKVLKVQKQNYDNRIIDIETVKY